MSHWHAELMTVTGTVLAAASGQYCQCRSLLQSWWHRDSVTGLAGSAVTPQAQSGSDRVSPSRLAGALMHECRDSGSGPGRAVRRRLGT